MVKRVDADEFSTVTDLENWQMVGDRIEATFDAESFDGAARFAVKVAEAANAADHHPDIAIRYPSRVSLFLTTHDAGSLTDLDLSLARVISGLAKADGLENVADRTSFPGTCRVI